MGKRKDGEEQEVLGVMTRRRKGVINDHDKCEARIRGRT